MKTTLKIDKRFWERSYLTIPFDDDSYSGRVLSGDLQVKVIVNNNGLTFKLKGTLREELIPYGTSDNPALYDPVVNLYDVDDWEQTWVIDSVNKAKAGYFIADTFSKSIEIYII